MSATVQGIEFQIAGDATTASDALDKLAETLTRLKTATSGGVGLSSISSELGGLQSTFDILKSITELDFSNLNGVAEEIKSISQAANNLTGLGGLTTANIWDTVASGSKYALGDPTHQWAKDMTAQIEFEDNGFLSNMRAVTDSSVGASAALEQFGNSADRMAEETTKAVAPTKNVSNSIKSVKEEAKKAQSPLSNIISSLKRIAFYRIIRSVIKSITESFSEGLENAYEWSRANSAAISTLYENASEAIADFKNNSLSLSQSLDLISTVSQTMKNQLGAAFGTLLQSLTPIITYLIRLVTSLASAITRLIAILSGKSTYLQAVDVWTEWGDAASDAGSSAKEALKYLAPFDELNRLPDASSSGSGSGTDTDYGDMFQEVSTDIGSGFLDTLTEAFENVAAWFEGKDWQELGSKLWESVKSIFTDSTKANECVSAFFEAIGSAFGAVAGTVWGFVSSAVDDLMKSFANNIKDYNGDNKITDVDILMAILKTGGDILHWVEDNIVTPFVNGFIRGLTDNDDFDFSVWVENNIVTPVKNGWNSIVDWINNTFSVNLPKIPIEAEITDVGVSDNVMLDDGIESNGSNPFTDGVGLGVMGFITRIKDNVANADKHLGDCVADVMFTSFDNLPAAWRNLKDCVAQIFDFEDKIPQEDKNIPVTGNMNAAKDNIPASDKIVLGTLRYRYVDKTYLTDNDKRVNNGTLRYRYVDKTYLTDNDKRVNNGSLRYRTVDKTYLTDAQKTIDTKSKFTTWANALGTPEIGARAKLWNFTLDSSIEYYNTGWMVISSILDIVGQKNIPTVKAYVPAAGSGGGGAVYDPSMMKAVNANMSYSVDSDSSEEVLYRAMVRALGDADFAVDGTLDGEVVYRAVVNRNKAMKRAYGVNPMLTT